MATVNELFGVRAAVVARKKESFVEMLNRIRSTGTVYGQFGNSVVVDDAPNSRICVMTVNIGSSGQEYDKLKFYAYSDLVELIKALRNAAIDKGLIAKKAVVKTPPGYKPPTE